MSTTSATSGREKRTAERVPVLPTDPVAARVHLNRSWVPVFLENINVFGVAFRSATLEADVGEVGLFELRHNDILLTCTGAVRHHTDEVFGFEFDKADPVSSRQLWDVIIGLQMFRSEADAPDSLDQGHYNEEVLTASLSASPFSR